MNKLFISGIDEAGRGSILGPLVIASVTADKKTIRKFSRIGIKDSKQLSPRNREAFAKIKDLYKQFKFYYKHSIKESNE